MQYNPPFGTTGDAGFVNGNPSAGVPGSIPPAEALEFTQREIVSTLLAAGLTPSNADLRQLMQAIRGGALSYFGDVGVANTLLIYPNPAYISYFIPMQLSVKVAFANTGPATINVNGIGPQPITKKAGRPLTGGEWSSGDVIQLLFNGTSFQIVGGGSSSGGSNFGLQLFNTPGTFAYNNPLGVSVVLAMLWAGGGAGGGVSSTTASGAGGGGGGWSMSLLQVTGGQPYSGIIGAGGPRTAAGAYNGANGGTSTFGPLSATGGSGGAGASSGFGIGKTPGGMGYGGGANRAGGQGRSGFSIGSTYYGGDGGSAIWSGDVSFTQGGIHDGFAFGQGGAGASSLSGAVPGGFGADGALLVWAVG